jgi:ATP-dependent protease ClpP protease subunit
MIVYNEIMTGPEQEHEFKVTRVVGNEILYYGEITGDDILEFIEEFKKLEIELLKKKAELIGYDPVIRIHICSEGGDLFVGLSAMNVLEKARVKVITIAQGVCCSAASFILLGGHERRIGKNAHVLIHQISTNGFWGKYEELKDEMKSCDKLMSMIKKTYKEKTTIPDEKIKKLMKRDIYLDPSECIKYGLVHSCD